MSGVDLYVCTIEVFRDHGQSILIFEISMLQSIIQPNYSLTHFIYILHEPTCHYRLEPYVCDSTLILPDPAGVPYMESDTQPPVTVTASEEDEVYSSHQEQYGSTMATKDVVHQLENIPTNKPSEIESTDGSPELVTPADNLVDDLIEASVSDTTLQKTTPTSQEGVASSNSSNVVLNALSSLWTSAWGSWQQN